MSNENIISDELAKSGIYLVGRPVQDSSEENKFYAFINVTRNKLGLQRPSNYKLRRISEILEKTGINVNFIVIEDEHQDVQASVKTTLFRSHPNIVRNVFISFNHKNATVWVEPKKVLTRDEENSLATTAEGLLTFLNIPLEAVRVTSSENVPTRTACLNVIRRHSPLTQKELHKTLVNRGFNIPNEEWLSKMLDNQRKAGHLIRKKNGQLVLTLSGLKSLGSTKNRRSPDISRVLDIARRGS